MTIIGPARQSMQVQVERIACDPIPTMPRRNSGGISSDSSSDHRMISGIEMTRRLGFVPILPPYLCLVQQ